MYVMVITDLYYSCSPFKYNRKRLMYFKTIVAPQEYKMNHPIYHNGDFEIGFYKLYYALIVNTLRDENRYFLRIGHRSPSKKKANLTERDRLQTLREMLNKKVRSKSHWRNIQDVVLSVESRMAKDCRLIQLADIFMGAIGYQLNNYHKQPNAKKGKVYLASHICHKLGKNDLCFETGRNDRAFNIFHLKV